MRRLYHSMTRDAQVNEQWGLYDGFDPKLEPVMRNIRRGGRHMPIMNVVPPGLDFSNLKASPGTCCWCYFQ